MRGVRSPRTFTVESEITTMQPETRYARCGNLHIAYQVVGEGPPDLVFVPGVASHLEHQWDEPLQAAFFHRLAPFSGLIRFDKRGAGLSDRAERMPAIEDEDGRRSSRSEEHT